MSASWIRWSSSGLRARRTASRRRSAEAPASPARAGHGDAPHAVLVEEQDQLEERAAIGPGRELAALLGVEVDARGLAALEALAPDAATQRQRERRGRRALAAAQGR